MAASSDSRSASSVAALVHGMLDLVPLPQAYVRIRQLVEDSEASLADVAQVVEADPALAGRVLRLANSAALARATTVDSIDRAVCVLGMNQIHDMALATSAVGSLSRLRADLFDLVGFWRLSIYAAVSARLLCATCAAAAPSRAFVTGLMHNIGNLLIAHELPQGFAECRRRAQAIERPYHELQRELFGFDYAEVGAELMRQWSLPAPLVEPVALHTRCIANLAADAQLAAALVHLAAANARAALWRGADSEPVPDYDPTAIMLSGIDAAGIEAHMRQADGEVVEFIAILMPCARAAPPAGGAPAQPALMR